MVYKHLMNGIQMMEDTTRGDWNVYCGFNGDGMNYVGYFPRSVIPTLGDRPVNISFGGFIGHEDTQQPPPMGSGYIPFENAASFRNLQLIDGSGKGHSLSNDLQHSMQGNCYKISHIFSSQFYYGGPNNCK
uniref:Neprosin PEP catalytic domain-containing protein n=1 Tax=Oryza punctata TaxID=4537 RepID=A0A0E0LJD7_ORYPU